MRREKSLGSPELAVELVGLKVDLILVWVATQVRAAMNATKTIPIVMAGEGTILSRQALSKALLVPAATSQAFQTLAGELAGKRLELLKEAVPRLARVAVLYDPAIGQCTRPLKRFPSAARALKLTIQRWEVRAADGFEKVIRGAE